MPYDTLLFRKHVLDSGLIVYFQRRPIPWFSCTLAVHAGERFDPPKKPGTAHLLEHLLSKGSVGYPRRDMTVLEAWAGRKGFKPQLGETGFDLATYGGTALVERADVFFRFLHAFVLHPLLETDLEKEIEAIKAERTENADSDNRRMHRLKRFALFGRDHPLARQSLWPEDDVLERMTYGDVREFHRAHYGCANMFMVVIGGFREDRLINRLNRIFVPDDPPVLPRPWPRPLRIRPPSPHSRRLRREEPESVSLSYEWLLPPKPRHVVALLSFCLKTMAFDNVRQKMDAGYDLDIDFSRRPDFSRITLSSEVPIGKLGAARRAIEEAILDHDAFMGTMLSERRGTALNYALEDKTVEETIEYAVEDIVADGEPTTVAKRLRNYRSISRKRLVHLRKRLLSIDRAYVEIIEQ